MNETDRLARNKAKLAECWPEFARKVGAVIAALEGHGFRPRIQEAWRSPARQMLLYTAGYSKLKYGLHNVTGKNKTPEALAVDLLDDDAPLNPARRYLLMLAASAKAHGLRTGIDWGLPKAYKQAINEAVSKRQWDYPGKIGWDPCHVEAAVAPLLARLGKRI